MEEYIASSNATDVYLTAKHVTNLSPIHYRLESSIDSGDVVVRE